MDRLDIDWAECDVCGCYSCQCEPVCTVCEQESCQCVDIDFAYEREVERELIWG